MLGQQALGEINPLLQLSQAVLHCLECLTDLADLAICAGEFSHRTPQPHDNDLCD
jgi:hypothetical protein